MSYKLLSGSVFTTTTCQCSGASMQYGVHGMGCIMTQHRSRFRLFEKSFFCESEVCFFVPVSTSEKSIVRKFCCFVVQFNTLSEFLFIVHLEESS